ncbi:hypothetical protein DUI87_07846 [Hirundo rustica rustica]|uniref:Uncharacterized protein n=1 Tax=Hirundo rustica rustica TaxID=333673 RepID=A0A3M0KW32_HIRRU|nr:hypothetical protein DUI87_07846 [Hirundo rustica rustica]
MPDHLFLIPNQNKLVKLEGVSHPVTECLGKETNPHLATTYSVLTGTDNDFHWWIAKQLVKKDIIIFPEFGGIQWKNQIPCVLQSQFLSSWEQLAPPPLGGASHNGMMECVMSLVGPNGPLSEDVSLEDGGVVKEIRNTAPPSFNGWAIIRRHPPPSPWNYKSYPVTVMEGPIFMAYTAEKTEEKNHHSSRQRFMSTEKMSHTNIRKDH